MELGDIIDDYVVFGPIGLGGMATVFAGFNQRSRDLVALKILRKEVDPGDHKRELFRTEGEMYHRLSHPNVVRFVGSGECAGQPYIALELVRGKSLKTLIRSHESTMSIERACNIMLDVARAIEHTHERGLIHRDVKPDNVIVTQDEMAKLIDYGIAAEKSQLAQGASSVIVGSPAYAAPEQNNGDCLNIRADLYSLGCVFFELLTGERALPGETLEAIKAAQAEPGLRRVRSVNGDVPQALDDIVDKLLRSQPLERYATATEFIAAVENMKRKTKTATEAGEVVFDKVSEAFEAAKLAYERGDIDGATVLAEFYLKERPRCAKGHFLLGKLMAEHEEYGRARDHFTRAVATDKFNVDYRIDFALHFFRMGKFRHSLEQIDAALGLAREDWVLKGLEKLTFDLLPIRSGRKKV